MTPRERDRKIAKLQRIRVELSKEARNIELSSSDRFRLTCAADALHDAIEAMERRLAA